jgi:uncharacterized repeat protein (TIGR03943 family)
VVAVVSREVQAAILLVLGVVVARLTLTGGYLAFVKSTLWLPLLLSAVVLLGLGAMSILRDGEETLVEEGEGQHDPRGAHGHDHSRAPRIGMLMLAPVLALLLVAPQPLGSHAASRGGANRVAVPTLDLGPLGPMVDGAVPLTLSDTVVRALYEPEGPLIGTPIRLQGFVAPERDLAGYRLSRFSMSCCAADASVRQVIVVGGVNDLPPDTWVEVVARFDGAVHEPAGEDGTARIPIVKAVTERQIDPPLSPYEY